MFNYLSLFRNVPVAEQVVLLCAICPRPRSPCPRPSLTAPRYATLLCRLPGWRFRRMVVGFGVSVTHLGLHGARVGTSSSCMDTIRVV